MNLLKHTILVALLFLLSFRFARCQSNNAEVTEVTESISSWQEEEEEDFVNNENFEIVVTEEWIPQADNGGEATEVTEESPVAEETITENWFPQEDNGAENTEVTEESTPTEEVRVEEEFIEVCEEMPIVEEEEIVVEVPTGEVPPFVEETEVNGHWMTLYPCRVSSDAFCITSYEPVCSEKEFCVGGHCRYRYETVSNMCNACKGHDNWQYATGKCPWEK